MGTFNNNSTWGKILNIVITVLTAILTTFGTASCMWQTETQTENKLKNTNLTNLTNVCGNLICYESH